MAESLKPFWIYWGVLVFICIAFLAYPLFMFILFPVLLFLVPAWFVVVYLIGSAVQQRSGLEKAGRRFLLSLFASCFTIAIFPVCLWICDSIKWNTFRLDSLIHSFQDRTLGILFVIHLLAFWIGEEIEYATTRTNDRSENF